MNNQVKDGLVFFLVALPAFAQADPWSQMSTNLSTAFTSTIARGMVLTATVAGGIGAMIDDGSHKRHFQGLFLGGAMAMGAQALVGAFMP